MFNRPSDSFYLKLLTDKAKNERTKATKQTSLRKSTYSPIYRMPQTMKNYSGKSKASEFKFTARNKPNESKRERGLIIGLGSPKVKKGASPKKRAESFILNKFVGTSHARLSQSMIIQSEGMSQERITEEMYTSY